MAGRALQRACTTGVAHRCAAASLWRHELAGRGDLYLVHPVDLLARLRPNGVVNVDGNNNRAVFCNYDPILCRVKSFNGDVITNEVSQLSVRGGGRGPV
jgi:hypothetical protein